MVINTTCLKKKTKYEFFISIRIAKSLSHSFTSISLISPSLKSWFDILIYRSLNGINLVLVTLETVALALTNKVQ